MTARAAAALLLGLATATFAAQPTRSRAASPPPAASVKPTQISESRSRQLIKSDTTFGQSSGLTITLHVEGNAVKDATSFGKINIAQAVDNLGTNLKPTQQDSIGFGPDDDGFREIRKPFSFGNKEAPKGFDIDLQLNLPPRRAIKLRALKGDFQVRAGGEKKTVTLTKLKSQIGKTLTDPALKAAGLTITVKDPKAAAFGGGGDGANVLVLEIKGPRNVIQQTEILDAAGQKISSGYSSMGSNDVQTTSYSLDKPLDDTITAKLQLIYGQQTVTLPFDLKNLDLP